MTTLSLDTFTRAYIECALWSSNDNADDQGGEPLDSNYSTEDIAPETLEKIKSDCAKFQVDNEANIGEKAFRAGYDFWLTRNHHGAGFWDGDWPEPQATRLTDAAHAFGEVDLYVGDDGRIYIL